MSIDELKIQIPDFAKDIRLKLSSMMSNVSLGEQTKYGLFLACAVATRHPHVISAFETLAGKLTKAAASVMAMNNIYYRFVHLASNKEYGTMPARLRMNVIGNPGVERTDFEFWSLQSPPSTAAPLASMRMRRYCKTLASQQAPSRPQCGLPQLSKRWQWRSRPAAPQGRWRRRSAS